MADRAVLLYGKGIDLQSIFPDAKIYRRHLKGHLYDVVFLDHWLNTLDREDVVDFLIGLKQYLKEDGEVVVTVPSLEWATQKVFTEKDAGLLPYVAMYGTKLEPAKSGFTIMWLRIAFSHAGYIVRAAYQEQINVRLIQENELMIQNTVRGIPERNGHEEAT